MSMETHHQKSWQDEYIISFYEVDTKNEVFLPVLWSFMQETAWHHADHLRVGYSGLMEQNGFWVLSRLSIQMEVYPRWGSRISVKTWLAGLSRVFALRQFSIADSTGQVIGRAKSAWLVLDSESRKPQRIKPLFQHIEHLLAGLPEAEEPEKIAPPVRPQLGKSFPVRYSDIDMHHHVNNTKYLEWILDSYPMEMNQTHHVQRLEINFLGEATHGDDVAIFTETIEGSPLDFLHKMIRRGDGRELCRASVGWKRVS